jgi:hypothetical protein
MTTIRLTMAQALIRYLAAQTSDVGHNEVSLCRSCRLRGRPWPSSALWIGFGWRVTRRLMAAFDAQSSMVTRIKSACLPVHGGHSLSVIIGHWVALRKPMLPRSSDDYSGAEFRRINDHSGLGI